MGQEARNRQKAKELGAPDAEALVATVPYLARLLSKKQMAQIQKVLDAAVLNPMYEEQYRKAMKDAVIARSGGLVLRDRVKERKAHRILDRRIHVSQKYRHIRMNHNKMLTANALAPRTDNPDEADYLVKVRQILNSKGIWLRLGQPYDPRGPDPRVWEFWFSLGYKGDTIETDDAIINREELLGTTMLGAGYYSSVMTGPVQTKLDRAFDRFDTEYDNGWSLHMELMRNRHSAAPGVAKVADVLGGASFPPTTIWDSPHKLRMTASQANIGGNVIKAQVYLLVAALVVANNAQLLADYLSKTIGGAETAVKILKVVEKVAIVAETVLMLVGVGVKIRALRVAGTKAISRDAVQEVADQYLRKKVLKQHGLTEAELKMLRTELQPKATVLGNVKGGHSAGMGRGNHRW